MCCRCLILSSEAYLFSLQLGSILCLLVLVFSFLSVLLPDFPFPAFVLCQQTGGACGLPRGSPVWVNVTALDKEELGHIPTRDAAQITTPYTWYLAL